MQETGSPRARGRITSALTTGEVRALLVAVPQPSSLVVRLLYGTGMRLREALRLRVKDVALAHGIILVHAGGNGRGRAVMLPQSLVVPMRRHLTHSRALWEQDRSAGRVGVWMPDALDRGHPHAGATWAWHWVFPADEVSVEADTGAEQRPHLCERQLQRHIREAAAAAGIDKRVCAHSLRHSFATHLLQAGTELRTVQALLGQPHASAATIYTHVLRVAAGATRSPLDALAVREAAAGYEAAPRYEAAAGELIAATAGAGGESTVPGAAGGAAGELIAATAGAVRVSPAFGAAARAPGARTRASEEPEYCVVDAA
ncbi:MAG: Tyrosine recombinase XerD [Gammaproteobacteria bacterium]|nr:Tyrosine recombinase XerD [Gammaproteobacteria bacterium]